MSCWLRTNATVLAQRRCRGLQGERRWSLGLSATPEREDDVDAGYDESLLGEEVGPIIYEFNLADALREGLVPKFTINHYGLPMTPTRTNQVRGIVPVDHGLDVKASSHRDSRSAGNDFFAWAGMLRLETRVRSAQSPCDLCPIRPSGENC